MNSLLDDRYFRTTVLVTEYYDPKLPLPPHDLVFNSIGDADLCREGLEAARALIARTSRPVINHPARVLKTGRAANAERLRGLPNVIVPRMVPFAAPRARRCRRRRKRSPATAFPFRFWCARRAFTPAIISSACADPEPSLPPLWRISPATMSG